MNEPWYIKSFQKDYLKIYSHRTEEAAKIEMDQILNVLLPKPNSTILDLCCGNGRHSRQLAKRGYKVTGIDLSRDLLVEAKNNEYADRIRYIQSDVREIPFEEEFDYVFNLFTSFGYFEDLDENRKVFQAIHKALKQNGTFLIDFLNPGYIRKNLVPESQRIVEDMTIIEKRKIEHGQVIKEIIVQESGESDRYYEERVNLFELKEMKAMLEQSRLQLEKVYGDFDLNPYHEVDSPRMILIGKK